MDQKLKLKVFPGTVLYCMYILHILHGSETEAESVSGYSSVLYIYFTYTVLHGSETEAEGRSGYSMYCIYFIFRSQLFNIVTLLPACL